MKEFDPVHREQLAAMYPAEIVCQITAEPLAVTSSARPDISLPYIHVRPARAASEEPEARRPILFVPGFGEGIINKAPFAAELADNGYEVVMPGQNRHGILRDASGKRNAVYTQARHNLDVAHEAFGNDTAADVVTHSYGSLVFQAMQHMEPERFADSNVFMTAPAGSVRGENLPSLARRWGAFLRSEADQNRPMEFPDTNGATGKASAKALAANPPRTVLEAGELLRSKMDYVGLSRSVGSLIVVSYAEDAMYPEDKLLPYLDTALREQDTEADSRLSWVTPVAMSRVASGQMRYGGHGATHDDEQFNPSRLVGLINQSLHPAIS